MQRLYIVSSHPDVLKGSAADMKRTNVDGVQRLLDTCSEVGVPKLINAASMAVANQLVPHHEETKETSATLC